MFPGKGEWTRVAFIPVGRIVDRYQGLSAIYHPVGYSIGCSVPHGPKIRVEILRRPNCVYEIIRIGVYRMCGNIPFPRVIVREDLLERSILNEPPGRFLTPLSFSPFQKIQHRHQCVWSKFQKNPPKRNYLSTTPFKICWELAAESLN